MDFKSLKEVYEAIKGEVIGELSYDYRGFINWIIDDYTQCYIDDDNFDYDVLVKIDTFFSKKTIYRKLKIPKWHPSKDFKKIYKEMLEINSYYQKYHSLNGFETHRWYE